MRKTWARWHPPGWLATALVITFLLQMAVYAARPTASYQALQLGVDGQTLGLVVAAYAVLPLFLAIPIGWWIDRWGEWAFLVAGAGIVAVVVLMLSWTDNVVTLTIGLALLGLGHLLVAVGVQTMIANRAGDEHSVSAFGIFTVVVSLGQLAGPALLGALGGGSTSGPVSPATGPSQVDATPVLVTAAIAAGVATLLVLVLPREQRRSSWNQHENDSAEVAPTRSGILQSVARTLRFPNMVTAMFASFTVLSSIDVLIVYLPAYGKESGLSVQTIGFLLATRSAASLASRTLIPSATRALGLGPLLVTSIALSAVSIGLFPLLTDVTWGLYLCIAAAGFGLGLGQPLTLTWVARTAPSEIRSTALGVRLAGNRFGQVAVPATVGGLVGLTGTGVVFGALTAMLTASAANVFRHRVRFGRAH